MLAIRASAMAASVRRIESSGSITLTPLLCRADCTDPANGLAWIRGGCRSLIISGATDERALDPAAASSDKEARRLVYSSVRTRCPRREAPPAPCADPDRHCLAGACTCAGRAWHCPDDPSHRNWRHRLRRRTRPRRRHRCGRVGAEWRRRSTGARVTAAGAIDTGPGLRQRPQSGVFTGIRPVGAL